MYFICNCNSKGANQFGGWSISLWYHSQKESKVFLKPNPDCAFQSKTSRKSVVYAKSELHTDFCLFFGVTV